MAATRMERPREIGRRLWSFQPPGRRLRRTAALCVYALRRCPRWWIKSLGLQHEDLRYKLQPSKGGQAFRDLEES